MKQMPVGDFLAYPRDTAFAQSTGCPITVNGQVPIPVMGVTIPLEARR